MKAFRFALVTAHSYITLSGSCLLNIIAFSIFSRAYVLTCPVFAVLCTRLQEVFESLFRRIETACAREE